MLLLLKGPNRLLSQTISVGRYLFVDIDFVESELESGTLLGDEWYAGRNYKRIV